MRLKIGRMILACGFRDNDELQIETTTMNELNLRAWMTDYASFSRI